MRTLGVYGLIVLLASPVGAQPASGPTPGLADGIRQVKDGDFEGALATLDGAVRALAASPSASKDLAQAYVYLGVAYLGLGQETFARSKFRLALQRDPSLRLSPDEFAARAIRVFESARQAEATATDLRKEARKGRGKGGLILLGVGVAAAAAIGLSVAIKERPNSPPTASLTILPEGQALLAVTTMTLTAAASDPDGNVLSYAWDFGDGDTATGPSVTHVFSREGQLTVGLTVSDGLTTTRATGTVTVGTLTGAWRSSTPGFFGETDYRIQQGGRNLALTVGFSDGQPSPNTQLTLSDPRNIAGIYDDASHGDAGPLCRILLAGQVDSALRTITGSLSCVTRVRPCDCDGRQQALTLIRQ